MGTKQFDNYADLITFTRASGATYLDSDGVLKTASTNTPRIEYDADGNRLGLLVEEQRINLKRYSEDFDNAEWIKFNCSLVTAVAPDGSLTARKIQEDSSNAPHGIYANEIVTSGTTYTVSLYAKAGEYNYLRLGAGQGLSSLTATFFNLQNGTIINDDGTQSITPVGNGWYRCTVTGVASSTSDSNVIFYNSPDGTSFSYTGDGTSGIYVWGAQLEAGAFPTSYIPTSGSTATRAADVASIPVSDFGYNQSEGTVVVEFKVPALGFANGLSINDGNVLNYIRITPPNSAEQVRIRFDSAYEAVLDGGTVIPGEYHRYGLAFAKDDIALSLDGGAIASDSSARIPRVNNFDIGAEVSSQGNIHIKSLKYYPRRLTNDQLQELTQ